MQQLGLIVTMGRFVGQGFLLFFFILPKMMKCDDNINNFISDLISSFGLMSPTLIYHGDAPEICFTHHWLLCLNLENEHAILMEEKGRYTSFRLT